MNKVILVSTVFLISFAWAQSRPVLETQPFTAQELAELIQDLSGSENNKCVLALIKDKSPESILKVKDDYRSYVSLEGSVSDWQKAPKICGIETSYYEIVSNVGNRKGHTQYRMNHTSYVYGPNVNFKFQFYTPYLEKSEMDLLTSLLRDQAETKELVLGGVLAKISFNKVTVKSVGGQEMVLASIEERLAQRAKECEKTISDSEETECEALSYSIYLSWIYNNFLSFSEFEGMDGSKFDGSINHIVSIDTTSIRPIKDIRDIFSEESLLAGLKKDWVIRNSNKWTRFANATTWDNFWSFTLGNYFGPTSEFQSYSNRLDREQASKVKECAQLGSNNKSSNAGYACVQKIRIKGRPVYLFNYQVTQTMLREGFSVSKMDENEVFVTLPLSSDSTGSAFLSLAFPRNPTDYFQKLSPY